MIQALINSLILLLSISVAIGVVFWKNIVTKPGERTRSVIATLTGITCLSIFYLNVWLMTLEPGQNIITFLHDLLT